MAQKKAGSAAARSGGDTKSSGTGGGRSAPSNVKADPAKSTTARGERPSPGARSRGETSISDRN